jgi:hypothetical protein
LVRRDFKGPAFRRTQIAFGVAPFQLQLVPTTHIISKASSHNAAA